MRCWLNAKVHRAWLARYQSELRRSHMRLQDAQCASYVGTLAEAQRSSRRPETETHGQSDALAEARGDDRAQKHSRAQARMLLC